ncbi:MAG: hypothetical protein LBV74_13070 [Tannerella sp.]|jgi:hypothetical protein|nr:hypothetical protein [Tannerella sp.]
MDSTTLYAEKARLVQSILNDVDDEKVLEKIKRIISKAVKYPARMTVDELKAEVQEATEEIRQGKVTKHDDFVKEMKSWK